MTADPAAKDVLRERLARLKADQIAELVLDLQSRIDGLRAELTAGHEPIAIVGQACRLPHAGGVEDFKRLLFAGENAVGAPPTDRPEADGLPPAGYIADIDRFDAGFFGFRAGEAAAMDPQHRLLMELAWHALEDAGYADRHRRPSNTGIFVGVSTSDYEERFRGVAHRGFTPQAITGNARSIAAGRLAHWLDTTGPALALDTACSSSLVAVHIACLSLRSGSCDMAVAAGVNALLEGDLSDGFEAAGMLSTDHACKTFDADANGYVRGEGGGVIVLKRLSDAERDGDVIRAVVRGGAINHDGRASALTAPNGSAQISVIRAALENAGLAPADVQVVECHGTGTPLGDPIEVQALGEAYGPTRESDLMLGAVKTNIGHLEAAAGIAGLIKMVLALEAGQLPPTLHQTSLNPRIAWNTLPVRVIDKPTDWPSCPTRRGGVSSFGFSGTNAHIILEAAPEVEPKAPTEQALTVLPLSAPDQEGVSRLAAALAHEIDVRPDLDPAAVTAASAFGRETFAERAAAAGATRDDLIDALKAIADGGGARGAATSGPVRIAFLFTGQGSQWSGMGRDLYDGDADFKAIIDACAGVLEPHLPYPLAGLMFDDRHEDLLLDTAIAQPTLFVLEYALAKRLEAWGIVPDIMIGHSLGELVAACLAGVMPLDDALKLTAERGRLMGSLPRDGAMAAVFAPIAVVEPFLAEHAGHVDIAAINGPEDCVISGEAKSVDAICDALEAQDIGCQRLRVSHAFHSALMEPVLKTFQQAVAGVSLSPPRIPVVSNVTATIDAPLTDPAYWARHVREPVRFADGMATVIEHGATVLVEVGATSALIGMAQRSLADAGNPITFIPTLRRNRPAAQGLGAALAQLFVAGAPIEWSAFVADTPRAVLPGYPFADERHWTPRPSRQAGALRQPIAAGSSTQSSEAPSAVSTPASPQEIRETVRALLARSMQLEPAALDADIGLFELGVDSLALTEAIAAVERRWRMTLARQAVFAEYNSARRLVAHVVDAISNQAGSAVGDVAPQPVADQYAPPPPRPSSEAPAATQQAGLSEKARAYLDGFARDYVERSGASRRQRETYGKVLADSRAVAGYRAETKAMLYPIIGAKGSGSHIVDLDGNDYVSLTMGFGVQLFGHNPAFVVDAMQRHLAEQGLFMGPQASLAGEVAARIARLTGNERVLFCNTGTEAVMTALRIARHTTGRSLVAMFAGSYHGHFDGTLARSGPDGQSAALAGGTPDGMVRDVLVLDYDDPDGSLETLQQFAGQLAAVIVEPVQSRRPSLQPRQFLQQLRAFTEEAGAALVFDDVLLGFRVAQGGSQAWADVRADLVTYGKIVGGGLPIGVVAGRHAYLDAIDGGTWTFDGDDVPQESRTFFAGTFNKNPMTMAASNAVLTHLEEAGPQLQETLNARTADFCDRLNAVLAEEQTPLRVDHFASVFRFSGANDLFFNHLIANGVYVWEGRTCFLSTAHTDADLDRVEDAVRKSVRAMLPAGLIATRTSSREPRTVLTTPGQQALWVLAAFSPETSSAYNQSLVLDLGGDLDQAALTHALQTLVERHDSLRSRFSDDGEYQTILDPAPVDLEQVDLADTEDSTGDAWIETEASQAFDLEAGPVLRATLLRLSPDRHRLVLIQPHIVTDGWSMQVLAVELGALYSAFRSGKKPTLSSAPPYRVYADRAREMAAAPEAAAHWRGLYATVPPTLDLPTDRPRPKLQAFDGDCIYHGLSAALSERLEQRARALGCSLFTLCLAGYARLLSQLSGQGDLAIAIFAAGQPLVGERSLTGYCVATLPVRLNGADTSSSRDLVTGTHQAMSDALAYPGYPFSSLIKALGMKRDPSRPPLTGVSFNLDRLDAEPQFDGLTTTLGANAHGSVRWDLNWNMLASADGLQIEANFNSGLFDRQRVEDWVSTYVAILDDLCDETDKAPQPATPDTPSDVQTLAHRVATWAATTPDAVAVLDRDGATDYAALDRSAAGLAGRLTAAGIGRGDRVAFKLDRGAGPVVAMLAAARIGAAFVPLDPDHPADHHAFILRDSGARLLITEPSGDHAALDLPVIAWRSDDDEPSSMPAPCGVAPDDLAYVLYTSGSTGRPKGVMVPWRAVETYSAALLARLGVDTPTSFAIVTSFAADLGYTSVFGALRSGGALHAIDAEAARDPNQLIAWFQDHPVDMMKIVPTHMAALMTAPDARTLLPRNALIFGGDVLTYDLVDRFRALGGDCRIFNHYGPTETTVGATMIEVTDGLRQPDDVAVPIGRPLDGYTIEVIGEDGGLLDAGITGELRIAGPAVAAGYVTPHGQERARFSRGVDGLARYATGDLGRRRDDGIIEFAGRKDDVVKIRGHQVDPAGIATLMRSHPAVRDAAVLIDRQAGRAPRLVAVVVTDDPVDTIAAWLSEKVPAALCPSQMTALDAIPLNANGKVDRTALLASLERPHHDAAHAAASEGGRVEIMCSIWREVLEVELVGPNDDFFALGGDSIVAIRVAGKARSAGLTISPSQIFEHATPATLAAVATSVDDEAPKSRDLVAGITPLTPIQRWFMAIDMAKRNQWALTAVFDLPAATTPDRLTQALSVLIKRHDALRTALRHDNGVAGQQVVDDGHAPTVITCEMSEENTADRTKAEDELANRLVASLDLDRGQVMAAGLITSPSGNVKRLVVAAHHVAFDMVSWGIVAEDIEIALTRGADAIPPVATPWSWWCSQLAGYAEAARPQLDYWQSVEKEGSTAIPFDHVDGANAEGDAREIEREINAEVTETLLTSSAETYGMQAHEIVLAALGRALVGWSEAPTIVELEGHGREPLDPTVDLSRTVGWFTTRYPLALPIAPAGDPRDWLVAVKEAVREIPQRGMGYGLLRYLDGADLTAGPTVSYNFVGEITRYGGDLGLVRLGAGQERDPAAQRPHLLVFTAWLDNGALCLRCQHAGKHATATVSALLDNIVLEITNLAEHCATASGRVYTPGDFTDVDFSQDELDQLTADILGSD